MNILISVVQRCRSDAEYFWFPHVTLIQNSKNDNKSWKTGKGFLFLNSRSLCCKIQNNHCSPPRAMLLDGKTNEICKDSGNGGGY